jgi:hypothetical protein
VIIGRRCELTAAILAEVSRLVRLGYRVVGVGPHGVTGINEKAHPFNSQRVFYPPNPVGPGLQQSGRLHDVLPVELDPAVEPPGSEPGSFLNRG